jgi:hypothetical protein
VKKRREKKVAVTSKEGRSDDDVKQMPFIVWCDVISCHVPSTDEPTNHEEDLTTMKTII